MPKSIALLRLTLCCVVVAMAAAPAMGIIVGTTDISPFSDPESDWYGMNWRHVHATRGGTSIAIGGYRMLAANHYYLGVGNTFVINGDQFEIIAISYAPNDPGETIGPDMRVLELRNNTDDDPLPGFYHLYTGSFTAGQKMAIVGTGNTGVDHGTYYTDTPDSRSRRWGTNEYSSSDRRAIDGSDGDTLDDWSTQCIVMNYNDGPAPPDTAYEAGLGLGDSGCGVLVDDGGVWKLAAMGLYRDMVGSSQYRFDNMVAASVPYYADWLAGFAPLTGDANFDDIVGVDDLAALAANWHTAAPWHGGDFSGDGFVGLDDLSLLAANWNEDGDGEGMSFPDAMDEYGGGVPEPATLALLVVGASLLALRRRRRISG